MTLSDGAPPVDPAAGRDPHRFWKMHGLGNDFVVLDRRDGAAVPGRDALAALADRRTGVGCDQVLVLTPGGDGADLGLAIFNPDGGPAEACGNGTRCVAALVQAETGAARVTIDTAGGRLTALADGDGRIAVDMGRPTADWAAIPLARAVDTGHLPVARGDLADGVGVGLGNPHAVFFVGDAEAVDLHRDARPIETDPLFPARVNVEVVSIAGPDLLRMRVWERGAGITRACGSGACAAVVAAHRRGLAGRRVAVRLDGGTLLIDWRDDDHVWMTGPVATVFHGRLDPALLAEAPR